MNYGSKILMICYSGVGWSNGWGGVMDGVEWGVDGWVHEVQLRAINQFNTPSLLVAIYMTHTHIHRLTDLLLHEVSFRTHVVDFIVVSDPAQA